MSDKTNNTSGPTHVRRAITAADVARQLDGGVPLAPGIWRDTAGGIHFSIPDLLDLAEVAHTPANIAFARSLIEAFLEDVAEPSDTIIRQDMQDAGPVS